MNRRVWVFVRWTLRHDYGGCRGGTKKYLISDGYLSRQLKVLCLETPTGPYVFSLKETGIHNSIGISKKSSKPLAISGQGYKQPFGDETFDFIFFGGGMMEKSMKLGDFVAEIPSTLKPKGWVG
ncbi:methyltransferase [Forsythia ovata]|uniref:Methyltransferase n=1 Tax=Forsythia ovata TaxID=205694 RepID=A0ABD1VMC2_9LAMI